MHVRPARSAIGTHLPLLVCALVLCAPLALSALLMMLRVAGVVGPVHAALQKLQTPSLAGMQLPAPTPVMSEGAVSSGAWQKQVEAWWNSRLPLRDVFVRTTNQAYYSWLNQSNMLDGKIAFGRDHHLFRIEHIEAFCNWLRITEDPAFLEGWARDLKQVQDYFTRRGKTFVYIVAPTKPPGALGSLPAGTQCPGPVDLRRKLALPAFAKAGLYYVDAVAILQDAARQYPGDLLFPPGGFHWTELGAILVLREAFKAAGPGAAGPPALPPFRYRLVHAQYTMDNELANVLNLWWRDVPAYLSPQVYFGAGAPGNAPRPLRLALVGDSFLNYPADILARTGMFSRIDHFYYFTREHRQYVDRRMTRPANTGEPPATYQPLLEADMVILEENQLGGIGSPYITKLREHLGLAAPAK